MATIEYRRDGAIARIRLQRPKNPDAIHGEMPDGLFLALEQVLAIDREIEIASAKNTS